MNNSNFSQQATQQRRLHSSTDAFPILIIPPASVDARDIAIVNPFAKVLPLLLS